LVTAAPVSLFPPPARSWYNHLDPAIKRGPWTEDEDRKIITLQHHMGNKWADIAVQIPGRCGRLCGRFFAASLLPPSALRASELRAPPLRPLARALRRTAVVLRY
jgi:hypothetical protein